MGGRSSGGGSFRPPARTPSRNTPKPAARAPPPAIAQGGTGSIIGSLVSSVADGIGWGAGTSIANRCMDYLWGPRVLRVENVSPTSAAPKTATSTVGGGDADACVSHAKAFQDCLNSSGTDIGKCQFYMDMLSECRLSSLAV